MMSSSGRENEAKAVSDIFRTLLEDLRKYSEYRDAIRLHREYQSLIAKLGLPRRSLLDKEQIAEDLRSTAFLELLKKVERHVK